MSWQQPYPHHNRHHQGGYAPPQAPPPPPAGFGYPPPDAPPPGGYAAYGPPPGPPQPWGDNGGGYGGYGGELGYGGAPSYAPPRGPPGPPDGGYGGYAPPPGPPSFDQGYGGGYGGGYDSYGPPSGPPPMPPSSQQNYGPQYQGPDNQVQQPFFQYSQCTGRKKALCIGINYIGTDNELNGCINDARNVHNFLCQFFGYKEDDIVVLTDDSSNPVGLPTRDNIMRAMQWLVRDARPDDSLFFHYSGHGGQTKDLDGDEEDGQDEVIYPMDFKETSHIVDDDMFFTMVKPLPPGCRLTAIFDSCHSGSALDLPYMYSTEGKIKEPNLALAAGQDILGAGMAYMRGDMSGVFKGVTSLFKTATGNNAKAEQYARATRTSPADVISWSGCKDSQTSADTVEAGTATGAMSYAFIRALSDNPQQSYMGLLNTLRNHMRAKYSQKPQLSASHPIDTNLMFIC